MSLRKEEIQFMAVIAAIIVVCSLLALGTMYYAGPNSEVVEAEEEVIEFLAEDELHIPKKLVDREEEILLHKRPSKED